MSHTKVDPDLVGIWLLPGQPQTYEITADGGYFIAEPDETLSFQDGGDRMIWGGRPYVRVIGEGKTPIGTWREEDTGDGWDFTPDHAYTVLSAGSASHGIAEAGETFTGIWALRNEGTSLWTCEKQSLVETDGAHLSFLTATGEKLTYGYAVSDGTLSLLDPDTWIELTRYISAERMVRSAAG